MAEPAAPVGVVITQFPALIPSEEEKKSIYDYVANQPVTLNLISAIMNGPYAAVGDVNKITSTFEKFKEIWNLNPNRKFQALKRTAQAFEQELKSYSNYIQDIQSAESTYRVAFIRIDGTDIKKVLIAKVRHNSSQQTNTFSFPLGNHFFGGFCLLTCLSLRVWHPTTPSMSFFSLPFAVRFSQCTEVQMKLIDSLHRTATKEANLLHEYCVSNTARLKQKPETLDQLAESIKLLHKLQGELGATEARFDPLRELYAVLEDPSNYEELHLSEEEKELNDNLRGEFAEFKETLVYTDNMLKGKMVDMRRELEDSLSLLSQHILDTRTDFKDNGPFLAPDVPVEADVLEAYKSIADFKKRIDDHRAKGGSMKKGTIASGLGCL